MRLATQSESLVSWALNVLECADLPAPSAVPVAGDASSRRYFRLQVVDRSYILAEAPPATEKNAAFLAIRDLLAGAGVRVPELLGVDLARGYLLLEDLGDRLLLGELNAESADMHYQRAFEMLRRLLSVDVDAAGQREQLQAYDNALVSEELGRFDEWYVRGLLGYELDEGTEALLSRFYNALTTSALAQPRVLVHRDFHSRNLMLLDEDALAVIDFQDAVVGPLTYDLVSVLRDCYIRWPAERVDAWALQYLEALPPQLRAQVPAAETFLQWFDYMGLQRHIKVLGTFARLYLRDSKSGYLADLPLVQQYVLEILAKYATREPIFARVHHWYSESLLPLVAQQPWSSSQDAR